MTRRVASIGECMIELRHRGGRALELAFGGDTLNTAVYMKRVGRGLEVDYVTGLGEDPYSEEMLASWRAEGVGTRFVRRIPGRLPGLYTIRTDDAGERTFHYWRSAAAARDMLADPEAEARAAEHSRHDLLYLSGITLSILNGPQRARVMALADAVRADGGRVAFDTNYRPVGWPDPAEARRVYEAMLGRCDIALPSLDDERRLFGDADEHACIARIAARGVREIVVKLAKDGCHVAAPGISTHVAAEPVARVVDSTAAGDSFNAAYLAARLADEAPEAAARAGTRLAARVICHPGAVIPAEAMADLMP